MTGAVRAINLLRKLTHDLGASKRSKIPRSRIHAVSRSLPNQFRHGVRRRSWT